MGADFIETAAHFIASELVFGNQFLQHIRKINDLVFRKPLNDLRRKHTQSIVDVPHFGQALFFVIYFYAALLEPDIARVPALVIFEHGHETFFARSKEGVTHRPIVDRQVGIAIQHIKRPAQ